MTPADKLPVPVLEHPHWRVNFRPSAYDPTRLKTLAECLAVLQKTRVLLRGFDFPHIPNASELVYGDTWIAGSTDFEGHVEYWRLYQSTQFLYLGAVREATQPEWGAKLRQDMKWKAGVDIEGVPGFMSLTNVVYNVTEYFELAARLAQTEIYVDPVTITITIKGISGFMLAAEQYPFWVGRYIAREGELRYVETFSPADLISSAADHALHCTLWFFERFGWLKPSVDAIRADQQKLLTRQF
jgi:hypothetical protein